MAQDIDKIRDFVLHFEKGLTTRRLYAPHMAPYKDSFAKILEKCQAAVAEEAFTLRVGATDLFSEKTSVVHRPKREECFFFPLFRDGLRELSFSEGVDPAELESLLSVFEADEKRVLGPSDDTVTFLWRCDLTNITYSAIDGIGETEGDDEGGPSKGEDYQGLIADLTEKIQNPALPETGQSYAFVLDADVKVAAEDLHYEATTTHKAFEESPPVLSLTREEATALQAEMGEERENILLARFVEILLAILMDPAKSLPGATLGAVFRKLLVGYWAARDFDSVEGLLAQLRDAAQGAPQRETRVAANQIVVEFLDADRLRESFTLLQQGAVGLASANRLWEIAGEEVWQLLIELWSKLEEGELRAGITSLLKKRRAFDPEMLRGTLASADASLVRAGLTLLDDRMERAYSRELVGLVSHEDEGLRLKGLASAGRIGGTEALEAVWRALEGDPSRKVRLYAFRVVAFSKLPGLSERLRKLIADPGFANRPAWEREKYARLLGTAGGDSVRSLFESMLPAKRWFWQPQDLDEAAVALNGLVASGRAGREEVEAAAAAGGKLGEVAKRILAGLAKRDPADMTLAPGLGMAVPAFARKPPPPRGKK